MTGIGIPEAVNQLQKILVLGGTSDARHIAEKLLGQGYHVIYSLAGVTQAPLRVASEIRIGGFGRSAGLAQYLQAAGIDAVVDATHPFATRISANAVAATATIGIQLLSYIRPPWQAAAGEQWTAVNTPAEAAAALPANARAMLTIGRKEIQPFASRLDVSGIMRMIEPPEIAVPANWSVILERPPQSMQSEKALMSAHRITHLVAKNAGGDSGRLKLNAAHALGLTVVLIKRPSKPAGLAITDMGRFNDAASLLRAVVTHPEK